MTLDKAIEILEIHAANIYHPEIDGEADAIKLGIEALKRIQECRLADYMIKEDYLPGETEE
jgi:hypothetical protein